MPAGTYQSEAVLAEFDVLQRQVVERRLHLRQARRATRPLGKVADAA